MFHCTSVWKNIWVDALTHQCRQCDLSSQWTRLSHLLFIQWHMSTGHRLTLSSLFLASHVNTLNYNTKIILSPLVGTIKVACECRMTSESNVVHFEKTGKTLRLHQVFKTLDGFEDKRRRCFERSESICLVKKKYNKSHSVALCSSSLLRHVSVVSLFRENRKI